MFLSLKYFWLILKPSHAAPNNLQVFTDSQKELQMLMGRVGTISFNFSQSLSQNQHFGYWTLILITGKHSHLVKYERQDRF